MGMFLVVWRKEKRKRMILGGLRKGRGCFGSGDGPSVCVFEGMYSTQKRGRAEGREQKRGRSRGGEGPRGRGCLMALERSHIWGVLKARCDFGLMRSAESRELEWEMKTNERNIICIASR